MKQTIIETNIVKLLIEMEELIQEGYRLIPNKSYLFTFPNYSLDMFKEEYDVVTLTDEDAPPKVTIEEYDSMMFMFAVQRHLLSGYSFEMNTINYNIVGTKRVMMFKEDHEANVIYTREELEAMSYEEIKAAAKVRGCFNRGKNQMITNILKLQGDW